MFKNLNVFRITGFDVSQSQIEEALSERAFKPCPSFMLKSSGWVEPYGEGTGFLKASSGVMLAKLRVDTKVLPKDIVASMKQDRVEKFIETTGNEPEADDIDAILDGIVKELAPSLLPKTTVSNVLICKSGGWIAVDQGSVNNAMSVARSFLSALGEPAEDVGVRKLVPEVPAEVFMTDWMIKGSVDSKFGFGSDCVLVGDEKSKVTVKNGWLLSKEVIGHINAGMKAQNVQLSWDQRMLFTVDKNLSIKGIDMLWVEGELEQEIANIEDEASLYDLHFSIIASKLPEYVADYTSLVAPEVDGEE